MRSLTRTDDYTRYARAELQERAHERARPQWLRLLIDRLRYLVSTILLKAGAALDAFAVNGSLTEAAKCANLHHSASKMAGRGLPSLHAPRDTSRQLQPK